MQIAKSDPLKNEKKGIPEGNNAAPDKPQMNAGLSTDLEQDTWKYNYKKDLTLNKGHNKYLYP